MTKSTNRWKVYREVVPFMKKSIVELKKKPKCWIVSVTKPEESEEPGTEDVACVTRVLALGISNTWHGRFKDHDLEYVTIFHFRKKIYGINLILKFLAPGSILLAAAAVAGVFSCWKVGFGLGIFGLILIAVDIARIIEKLQEEGSWAADEVGGGIKPS